MHAVLSERPRELLRRLGQRRTCLARLFHFVDSRMSSWAWRQSVATPLLADPLAGPPWGDGGGVLRPTPADAVVVRLESPQEAQRRQRCAWRSPRGQRGAIP